MEYLIVDPDIKAADRLMDFLRSNPEELNGGDTVRIRSCRSITEEEIDTYAGTECCVILEISVQDTADGLILAERLRNLDEDIPIVFCSDTNDYAMQCYDLNIAYYLQKPVSAETVSRMRKRVRDKLKDRL